MKAADKQGVWKKIASLLKKHYPPVAEHERPVLESMLFAICLENASIPAAERWYGRLTELFHDLNEARVSSVIELSEIFDGSDDAEMRASRMKATLQFVFEKHFLFDFEPIRKKTLELAQKQLLRIRELTPFVRNYTLHAAIGSHLIALDDALTNALIWLGMVDPGEIPEKAGETIKAIVRKAEAEQFLNALRSLATDPRLMPAFTRVNSDAADEEGYDPATAVERLQHLIEKGEEPKKPSVSKSAASAKSASAASAPSKAAPSKSEPAKSGPAKPAAKVTESKKSNANGSVQASSPAKSSSAAKESPKSSKPGATKKAPKGASPRRSTSKKK